jgi:NifU-like protein
MAWEYSEKVKDLFMKAITNKDESHFGTIDNPDGTGSYGSIACGDAMVFYFKVQKDKVDPRKDIIIESKYKTFGCTSAIASSEALCIMIEEQKLTPIDAMKITSKEIVDFLGGMPTQKIHCSVMGTEVLKVAVSDWAKKRGLTLAGFEKSHDDHDEGKMVCHCFGLSDTFIKKKVQDLKLQDAEDIKNSIKAGGGCGMCVNSPDGLNAIIQEVWGKTKKNPDNSQALETQKIHKALLEAFEGDAKNVLNYVELVDIKDHMVYCIFENEQDKISMEKYLHDHIDKRVVVIDV